jgi:hypothetical protein
VGRVNISFSKKTKIIEKMKNRLNGQKYNEHLFFKKELGKRGTAL